MNFIAMLLFFLSSKFISFPIYEYKILKEIRYVQVVGEKTINIKVNDELIYTIQKETIVDLKEYYSIYSIQVEGSSFVSVSFYHDQELVAVLLPSNKSFYRVEDMILEENYYSYYSVYNFLETLGSYLVSKSISSFSVLNLSSFVESIVLFPKKC